MDISGIIVGAVLGVGGMIVKEKFIDSQTNSNNQEEIKKLYALV